jgi:hypothetical protein
MAGRVSDAFRADRKTIPTTKVRICSVPDAALRAHRGLGQYPAGRATETVEREQASAALDYEVDAIDFNRSYFLRNAVKCSAMLDLVSHLVPDVEGRAVIDVGGGVGTFALMAAHVWPTANFTIFDRSLTQLQLGKTMALTPHGSGGLRTSDLAEAVGDLPPAICLFSYSLCETPELFVDFLNLGAGAALVIDYPDIIEECSEIFQIFGGTSRIIRTEVGLDIPLSEMLGQPTVKLNGGLFVRTN